MVWPTSAVKKWCQSHHVEHIIWLGEEIQEVCVWIECVSGLHSGSSMGVIPPHANDYPGLYQNASKSEPKNQSDQRRFIYRDWLIYIFGNF